MIHYLFGNATDPQLNKDTNNYIIHCCNDKGRWGSGFVLALNRTFGLSLKEKYQAFIAKTEQPLGQIDIVQVKPQLFVVNMIGQHDTHPIVHGDVVVPPVRYESLANCLIQLDKHLNKEQSRIHFPLFGAGLAGGCWTTIHHLINSILADYECYGYVFLPDTQYHYLVKT